MGAQTSHRPTKLRNWLAKAPKEESETSPGTTESGQEIQPPPLLQFEIAPACVVISSHAHSLPLTLFLRRIATLHRHTSMHESR